MFVKWMTKLSPFEKAAKQLEKLVDADTVVIYVALTTTEYIHMLGKGGIPVSVIRQAVSLREFILSLIDQYQFSGPQGDIYKVNEEDIESIWIKQFF